jgi:hypothetical protein
MRKFGVLPGAAKNGQLWPHTVRGVDHHPNVCMGYIIRTVGGSVGRLPVENLQKQKGQQQREKNKK